MKTQFNEYFVRQKLLPLVVEMLTDLGQAGEEGSPKAYLRKLIDIDQISAREKLTPEEQRRFKNDYFPEEQRATRPFTGETDEDKFYRLQILESMRELLRVRVKLSGEQGLRNMLIPVEDEDEKAGSPKRMHIYKLAYSIAIKLEKKRIQEQLAGDPRQLNKELESGELKEIQVGEGDYVMSEQEVGQAVDQGDGDLNVVPLITPGLGRTLENYATGQATPAPLSAEQEQPQESALEEIGGDFDDQKAETYKQILEESGLQVEGSLTIVGDVATGIVIDKSGQQLSVRINLNANNLDEKKFLFSFLEGRMAGFWFYQSQEDLGAQPFTISAAPKVYDEQFSKGRDLAGELPGEEGFPVAAQGLGATKGGELLFEGEAEVIMKPSEREIKLEGEVAEKGKAGAAAAAPAAAVEGAKQRGALTRLIARGETAPKKPGLATRKPKKTKIKPAPMPPGSVMAKKREIEQQRVAAVPTRTAAPAATRRRRRQTTGLPVTLPALGTTGAAVGISGLATWLAMASEDETATAFLNFVLDCINFCFA